MEDTVVLAVIQYFIIYNLHCSVRINYHEKKMYWYPF